MASLTALDIIVLLLMGIGALAGLSRGFVTEVLSLAAWVAGFAAVRLFYVPAKAVALRFTGTEAAAAVLAFAAVFLTAYLIVRALAGGIGGATRKSLIGPLDRLLGFGFGGLKGLLVGALIYTAGVMVFDVIDPERPRPDWLVPHRTAPLVEATSKAMTDFVAERRARAEREHAKQP